MHARNGILKSLELALRDSRIKDIGTRVFFSRSKFFPKEELPGIRGYIRSESIEYISIVEEPQLRREATLVIEVCVVDSPTIDDDLDRICSDVEKVIGQNQRPGSAQYVKLKEVVLGFRKEQESPLGIAQLVYEVLYVTKATSPDVAI